MQLNEGQARAKSEIMAAYRAGVREYLLTGYAGSGKTFLMNSVFSEFESMKIPVQACATSHKAVSVLRKKIPDDVPCRTIHSLLSLTPKPQGDRTILKRSRNPTPIECKMCAVDEVSMAGDELLGWCRDAMSPVFRLYVGDPAQLNPVGERESPAFSVPARSHLDSVVRQGAGNPILDAATAAREAQESGSASMAFCEPRQHNGEGIYDTCDDLDRWLKRAFLSSDFDKDNDFVRYVCWTNKRVAAINGKIRHWKYGHTDTPFVPGERVLLRSPLMKLGLTADQDKIVFNTNDEVIIDVIESATLRHRFAPTESDRRGWSAELSAWRVEVVDPDDAQARGELWISRDQRQQDGIDARLRAEARDHGSRWGDRFRWNALLPRVQSVYALTGHTSQGSTFVNAFVDTQEMRSAIRADQLEGMRLLYVAVTRPTTRVILARSA